MKNKFHGYFILVLFFLLLFNLSCKNSEGVFLITSGEGHFEYDGIVDMSSDLRFHCVVLNQSEIPGTITAWKFVFKFGNTELLEINSENCSSYNIAKDADSRIGPYKETRIECHTNPAIKGNIFNSSIPDNVDVSVTITDDNSNLLTIHFNATVTYNIYDD